MKDQCIISYLCLLNYFELFTFGNLRHVCDLYQRCFFLPKHMVLVLKPATATVIIQLMAELDVSNN